VNVDLGVDDVGEDLAAIFDDGHGGLVARRFNPESQRQPKPLTLALSPMGRGN
jgi:hypothetical protein